MNVITLRPDDRRGTINRNLYGHFSEHLGRCIYNGIFVGADSPIPNVNGMRTDVVEALKRIRIPVLRWPGGCFADEYHWRDGIGPRENRKRMVNTHWGYVVEDNSFGTHEFLELCRQLDCAPYINANVGSGTVREMSEWVEYLNSDGDSTVVLERMANGRREPFGVKYWGVGNESWGCGGHMRAEYYADEFRRYQTYCRNYGDNRLFRIACGPNTDDYRWTRVLLERAGQFMDALTMHYYTTTGSEWNHKGKALDFTREEYYELLNKALYMDELVTKHSAIMDEYDPERRIGLIVDEWGSWHQVEEGTNPGFLYQQNTMRDALVAAIHLNIFNRHCERVVMANLAQTVNVLQSVILTEGDRMALTPTYHVFDLYKAHQGAELIGCDVSSDAVGTAERPVPTLTASASEKDGRVTLTVAHLGMDAPIEIALDAKGLRAFEARVLTAAPNAYNDFETTRVKVAPFESWRAEKDGTIRLTVPPCAVIAMTLNRDE